jgi:chemotaxis protein MotB
MNNKFKLKRLTLFVALGIFASSCVSNRKFLDEQSNRTKAETAANEEKIKRQNAEAEVAKTEEKVKNLNKDLMELQLRYDKQKNEYEQQTLVLDRSQKANDDLRKTYESVLAMNDRLNKQIETMLKDADNRKRELSDDNAKLSADLQKRAGELADKEAALKAERANLEKLRKDLEDKTASLADANSAKQGLQKDLAEREKRVQELEAAIAERDAKAKALKDKLAEALRGFQASDLSVEERNGKVYVSLSQNLLFAAGSSKLDAKGASALVKLADVLNKNVEIDVNIEGHTDSDGDEKANWKLSTERSLSIVDELIRDKVEPSRLSATGRGEHVPIGNNATADGKAKNRRTDIILTPKLDVIYNMLKN